jgi:hypothetical protein
VERNEGKVSRSSLKKIEANRRNSLLSTGPKTSRGKRHSRRNALKHGILASVLLIRSGEGAEDACEFDKLLAALHRDLVPIGQLEEMMVERIAVCWWRQRRAILREAELIMKASYPDLLRQLEQTLSRGMGLSTSVETEAINESVSLPLGTELERILHYETTIQRQLIFSIRELEHLQRSRRGEVLPAPVQIQLSDD